MIGSSVETLGERSLYLDISCTTKEEGTIFKSVRQLRENYLKKLETTAKKLQAQQQDDSLLAPPPSGYCSGSDDERCNYQKTQVRRSGSSDSAVGLTQSDEDEKREEYKPVFSPYSPRGSVDHSNVPSR